MQLVWSPRMRFKCRDLSSRVAMTSSKEVTSRADLEERVRQLYDYDAIVAQAPSPETVQWVFG